MRSIHVVKLFATTIMLLVASANANAYIDPGTGSLLIQGLIAALATIVTTASLYYHRIVNFFSKGKSNNIKSEEDTSEDSTL